MVIVPIYWMCRTIEEAFRFVKQSYYLDDMGGRYQRLKDLAQLVTAAAYLAATFGGKNSISESCVKSSSLSRDGFSAFPRSAFTHWRMVLSGFPRGAAPVRPLNRLRTCSVNYYWLGSREKMRQALTRLPFHHETPALLVGLHQA